MFFVKCFGIASLVICLQFCTYVNGTHFWVHYNGIVPDNAVIGGIIDNTITYIGQALFFEEGAGLQPVRITNGSLTVRAYHGGVLNVSSDIKVLCSDEDLKWVDRSYINISNKVIGGSEIGESGKPPRTSYIGRSLFEGQLVTGKVVILNSGYSLLSFEYEESFNATDTFDVLTY